MKLLPIVLSSKYLDRLIPSKFDGINLAIVILIRFAHKDDEALLVHEKHHSKQLAYYGPIYVWKYYRNRKFRLKVEAEAYAAQIKVNTTDLEISWAATHLWKDYDLKIQYFEAKQAIYDALIGQEHA